MSAIEWTDRTWNPCVGCAKVSAGCKNCYAERQAYRVALMEHAQGRRSVYLDVIRGEEEAFEGHWNGRAKFLPERLAQPLKWRKPCRVFVNSMSDLFHSDITVEQVASVWEVMRDTPRHTYQILTKRPARMLDVVSTMVKRFGVLPNVWLGVSVEDQKAADHRIPWLQETGAALRFLSVEPLLGPVDLQLAAFNGADSFGKLEGIGWVIVGGESGPGARVCDLDWIREVVTQCRVAGVPCFVKQLGAAASDAKNGIAGAALKVPADFLDRVSKRLRDRKGGDMSEWPAALRVRQFPEVKP
jgi:protein gp37